MSIECSEHRSLADSCKKGAVCFLGRRNWMILLSFPLVFCAHNCPVVPPHPPMNFIFGIKLVRICPIRTRSAISHIHFWDKHFFRHSGYYIYHLLQHSEALHFSTLCICVFCIIRGINNFFKVIHRLVLLMENHCFFCDVGIRPQTYMHFRVQIELDFALFVTVVKLCLMHLTISA